MTTTSGAAHWSGRLPDSCDVIEIGTTTVDVGAALTALRERGYSVLLTEGGPHLMADLLEARVLDEAFITVSPVIAGRDTEQRLGMVAGVEFLPSTQISAEMVSVRRQADFLFLRYDFRNSAKP